MRVCACVRNVPLDVLHAALSRAALRSMACAVRGMATAQVVKNSDARGHVLEWQSPLPT